MLYSTAFPARAPTLPSVYSSCMTMRATPDDRRIPAPTAAESEVRENSY